MSIVDILRRDRLFAAFLLLLLLPMLLPLSVAASTSDWQQQVSDELCQRWQDIGGPGADCSVSFPGLSPNFQLQHCEQPWQINLLRPLQPGRNGLEISCEQPWWRQNLAVQIQIFREVAVLARSVSAGQKLTAADISLVRHDIGGLSKDFLTSADTLPGMELRRTLRAGTVLSRDMIALPVLVERGQQVNIRVQRPGIRIEMKGTALDAGSAGDRIRVRNDSSQKIIRATVLERGLVQVD